MKFTMWLVFVWEDVEPSLLGPFDNDEERLEAALVVRKKDGKDHGLYRLNINKEGLPEIDSFSGGELDMDDNYCSKCGQSFAVHNDDGSCVED
jgi:hypothetical protein